MEVSMAIVGIGKETRLIAVEQVSIAISVRNRALTSHEDLTYRTAEERWEQYSRGTVGSHTHIVDVGIQWPGSHVTDIVASELIARTDRVHRVE